MKKVFSALVLTSLLVVLLVPVVTFAAECPNCTAITVQCTCGANVLPAGGLQVCSNSTVYPTLSACQTTGGAGTGYEQIPTNTPSTPGEIIGLIDKIGNWLFTGLLGLAAIFLVVAGFFFVTANGDPEKIKKAREMLINAIIGVAIGVASKGLVQVIKVFILK